MIARCPALFIAAPASGQGKTSVTAGLARLHRRNGRRVRVFKTGPDFLDPIMLEHAGGMPVYNLDLWMGGERHCRELLHAAARSADVILIEGVMGLYDGSHSSADLAQRFGVPVALVIDAAAMAQTFAAVAEGLVRHRPALPVAGVLANGVGGGSHAALLEKSMSGDVPFLGALARGESMTLPSRHLGLLPPAEVADLDRRLDDLASALTGTRLARLPPATAFHAPAPRTVPLLLRGVRIAVARDPAFTFLYPANLDTLRQLGAELSFFSPLRDRRLPDCHALYLPGGYPELHLRALDANRALHGALADHHARGRPTLAECGGLLYLLESLTDAAGGHGRMAGVLPGRGVMERNLVNLGLHTVNLPEGELRGHTFHHSRCEVRLEPIARSRASRHHGHAEAVYRTGRLTASYLHLYFPSNPEAAARLFAP
jgi:cobyrinic acid a,c-diamide synthase